MAASAVFILDLKGHVILFRDYRGDVPIKHAERFITKLNELEEAGKVRKCTRICRAQDSSISVFVSSSADLHVPLRSEPLCCR